MNIIKKYFLLNTGYSHISIFNENFRTILFFVGGGGGGVPYESAALSTVVLNEKKNPTLSGHINVYSTATNTCWNPKCL